jgi:hypothetical protein
MYTVRQMLQAVAVAASVAIVALTLVSCNNGQPVQPLAITSGSPPNGTVGAAYNFDLTATGGEGGLVWAWHASPGSTLPPGLSVSMCLVLTPPGAGCSQPQAITGVPTTAGTYKVVVTLSDIVLTGDTYSTPQHASATYTITIAP